MGIATKSLNMFLLKKITAIKLEKEARSARRLSNKKDLNSHLNQNIMLWWSKEDWNTEPLHCPDNSGTL